jgi:4-hydroxybenzoate polyprenyltransferase
MVADYVKIMRIDHWYKNVFMLPGLALGWLACPPADAARALWGAVLGCLATCLVCSANYTINEYLDAPTDRRHPGKKDRPAAQGRINLIGACAQWMVLGAAGLALAWPVNRAFFLSELALLAMGIVYNVRPMRSKDRPYVDVLTEAVNNPLRLLLGWYAVGCWVVPPISLVLSYWMLGAYLMAIKRFAELRHIGDRAVAAAYRSSFAHYTEERLLVSIMFYTTACALFAGIFLVRYHTELVLGVPFLAGFMAVYMRMGLLPDSPVQYPEKLYKQHMLTAFALLTAVVLLVSSVVKIQWLRHLVAPVLPEGL